MNADFEVVLSLVDLIIAICKAALEFSDKDKARQTLASTKMFYALFLDRFYRHPLTRQDIQAWDWHSFRLQEAILMLERRCCRL